MTWVLGIAGIILILVGIFTEDGRWKLVVLWLFVVIAPWFIRVITDASYKQGQVDAQNGKWEYYLKTNPDQTQTWERATDL